MSNFSYIQTNKVSEQGQEPKYRIFWSKRASYILHRIIGTYRRNKKHRKTSKTVYICFLLYTYLAEYLASFDP